MGWVNTVFNTALLIYYQVTLPTADFSRSLGPYLVGEFTFWLSYYLYYKPSFKYLRTEYLMPIAGREMRPQQESMIEEVG